MNVSDKRLVLAFNEWMRRYEKEPEKFEREYNTIKKFLKEQAEGKVPTYGEHCVAYLNHLLGEQKIE
jgi:hypothetical protein